MHWIAHIEGGPKRVNHAAVAVGHKVYTFGGYCTGGNSRDHTSIDVHVLNTTTFRWTQHPVSDLPYFENDDILPYKRYGHTAVLHGEKIYIWGGRNDIASCSELFCFDTVWHCWQAAKTTGDVPMARDGHSSCVWRDKMYIFGGYEDDSDVFARNVYCLSLETLRWSCIHNTGEDPTVRDFHTTVCINNKMYLFGGRGTDARNGILVATEEMYDDQIWYLDLLKNEWHKPNVTGDRPIGRRSHSAFVHDNKMYIFGGYNAVERAHYNDMWEFNTTTNTWKCIVPLGESPSPRRRHAFVLVDDQAFLFGGTSPIKNGEDSRDQDQLMDYSDMHVLNFRPTLKTLCLVAMMKYNLNDSFLPIQIRIELKNMRSANTITLNRTNNSSG